MSWGVLTGSLWGQEESLVGSWGVQEGSLRGPGRAFGVSQRGSWWDPRGVLVGYWGVLGCPGGILGGSCVATGGVLGGLGLS